MSRTQPFGFCAFHRLQNETAAEEILASIQSYFRSQPFDFRGAQIISGQEEGVYGWITANYIQGNFLEVCGLSSHPWGLCMWWSRGAVTLQGMWKRPCFQVLAGAGSSCLPSHIPIVPPLHSLLLGTKGSHVCHIAKT